MDHKHIDGVVMSRIEKAIEIAARKRNAATVGQLSNEALPAERENASVPAPIVDHQDGREALPAPRHTDKLRQPVALPASANQCLVMANSLDSLAAEQYRKLKSVIVKKLKGSNCGLSLMITSPVAGEGKSVTALNLAISLSQEFNHTVLLVEADLRKPSLLQYLGLQADLGLSDCVLDGVDVGTVLIKTTIEGLTVLPAGRPVDNPVELFSSNRMQDLFTEIKGRYPDRFVIVDTTPLLPFADPQYIANAVDGVVLVVRERLTSVDKLKRALELLKNHNLLGVVCNGVSQAASLQGYYGYYGYRY